MADIEMTEEEIVAKRKAIVSHLRPVTVTLPSYLINLGDDDTTAAAVLAVIYAAGEAGLPETAAKEWLELVSATAFNIGLISLVAEGALTTSANENGELTYSRNEAVLNG